MNLELPSQQPVQTERPALVSQKFIPKDENLSKQISKFIAKESIDDDLPALQTIPKNIDSDDDLPALPKKPPMKASTAVMLTHARAYAKKGREYLKTIYKALKEVENGKSVKVIAQGLREVYANDRDSLKKRKESEKKHGLVDLFWGNMPVENAQNAIDSRN